MKRSWRRILLVSLMVLATVTSAHPAEIYWGGGRFYVPGGPNGPDPNAPRYDVFEFWYARGTGPGDQFTWQQARDFAASQTRPGPNGRSLQGYLATPDICYPGDQWGGFTGYLGAISSDGPYVWATGPKVGTPVVFSCPVQWHTGCADTTLSLNLCGNDCAGPGYEGIASGLPITLGFSGTDWDCAGNRSLPFLIQWSSDWPVGATQTRQGSWGRLKTIYR